MKYCRKAAVLGKCRKTNGRLLEKTRMIGKLRKVLKSSILFLLVCISICTMVPFAVSAYEYDMIDGNGNIIDPNPAPASAVTQVRIKVSEHYDAAFQVLKLVNKERKSYGLKPLTMDKGLLNTAMLRAAETVLYFEGGHLRPEGTYCFTADHKMIAENMARGVSTAKGVVMLWMNSSGHRENILRSDAVSIGIGCVEYGGTYYWVQNFGLEKANKAVASGYKNKKKIRIINVDKYDTFLRPIIKLSSRKLRVGKTASVKVQWNNLETILTLKNSGLIIESANPKICRVKNGKLYGVKNGKAKIRFYYPGNRKRAVVRTVTVTK